MHPFLLILFLKQIVFYASSAQAWSVGKLGPFSFDSDGLLLGEIVVTPMEAVRKDDDTGLRLYKKQSSRVDVISAGQLLTTGRLVKLSQRQGDIKNPSQEQSTLYFALPDKYFYIK